MTKKTTKPKPIKPFSAGDDEFKALIPSVLDDPRENALWSLRVKHAKDLDSIRLLLLRDIENDPKSRATNAVAYCKVSERQSRILGLDEPIKQEHSFTNYDSIVAAFRRGEREGQPASNTDQINAKKEP